METITAKFLTAGSAGAYLLRFGHLIASIDDIQEDMPGVGQYIIVVSVNSKVAAKIERYLG